MQAALFLASCTTLVTTVPPRPDIVDYTTRGPHILLWVSFNLLCTSIIFAGGDVYLIYACGPDTVYDVRPYYYYPGENLVRSSRRYFLGHTCRCG